MEEKSRKTVKLKDMKIRKMGKKFIIIIPVAILRKGILDIETIYDLDFDPIENS